MARSQQSLRFGSSSKRKRSATRKRKTVKVRSYTRKQGKLPGRDSKGRFKSTKRR